jgi:hypothetical protein
MEPLLVISGPVFGESIQRGISSFAVSCWSFTDDRIKLLVAPWACCTHTLYSNRFAGAWKRSHELITTVKDVTSVLYNAIVNCLTLISRAFFLLLVIYRQGHCKILDILVPIYRLHYYSGTIYYNPQSGLLCTPQNVAQSSEFLGKKYFFVLRLPLRHF